MRKQCGDCQYCKANPDGLTGKCEAWADEARQKGAPTAGDQPVYLRGDAHLCIWFEVADDVEAIDLMEPGELAGMLIMDEGEARAACR